MHTVNNPLVKNCIFKNYWHDIFQAGFPHDQPEEKDQHINLFAVFLVK